MFKLRTRGVQTAKPVEAPAPKLESPGPITSTQKPAPITSRPLPADVKVMQRYPILEPYVSVVIAEDPERKNLLYLLDEVKLTRRESYIYNQLLDYLQVEMKIPRADAKPSDYFIEQAKQEIVKYRMTLGSSPTIAWSRILYYAHRDMVGFGALDPFMRDLNIEDVSVDGVGKPVFVWHRKYESVESNLVFRSDQELDDTLVRLVHLGGRHISSAHPIVDATLPGRHRLAGTYRHEVSNMGSTINIRKFREDPITIIDMINFKTIDHTIAAYLWLMLENRASVVVVGATAAGKTTLMNALLTMVRSASKIITIEEVQEVNIPHQNWVPLVSRQSYGLTSERVGEVSLFHLVKAAMRMRPDVLVVGEVRGEEAYALFQAISTGHGGLCTLHADDARSAIQRLTSKPMDVAPSYIPFLDLVLTVRRVGLQKKEGQPTFGRRIISLDEVVKFEEYNQIFHWDPAKDVHVANRSEYINVLNQEREPKTVLEESVRIQKLARDLGLNVRNLIDEIERRRTIFEWLQSKGIRNYRELATVFERYHNDPADTYEQAMRELAKTKQEPAYASEDTKRESTPTSVESTDIREDSKKEDGVTAKEESKMRPLQIKRKPGQIRKRARTKTKVKAKVKPDGN